MSKYDWSRPGGPGISNYPNARSSFKQFPHRSCCPSNAAWQLGGQKLQNIKRFKLFCELAKGADKEHAMVLSRPRHICEWFNNVDSPYSESARRVVLLPYTLVLFSVFEAKVFLQKWKASPLYSCMICGFGGKSISSVRLQLQWWTSRGEWRWWTLTYKTWRWASNWPKIQKYKKM